MVLNVGTAHIGEFGGREQIAQAKGELVEALPEDGVAVLNADDPLVRAMAARTRARVVLFGEAADAHVRAEDVRLDARGRPVFTLRTPSGCADVTLRLYGEHHVSNALAAAAVAGELGMPVSEDRVRALRGWPALPLADGGRRAAGRCDGRQRCLQRESRVDAGRAARPCRHVRSRGAAPGRCWARWPNSAGNPSPSTTRWDGSPSGSTSASS